MNLNLPLTKLLRVSILFVFRVKNRAFELTTNLGHPHLEQFKALGYKYRQKWHGAFGYEDQPDNIPSENRGGGYENERQQPKSGTCRVQVVRSVCDWSHGVLTEHSIQDACTSSSLRRH